ncbi:MAG TPA: NAD(P)-dependent oxidoreductase [Ramlibacter sp.]|uniref:NAD(P)-dependent oxidoreductase n=1 Tax=Ramlibacter sp. TaxID=1917967 RepID=UPI002C80DC88|nr:NAD(P)-dependent oxidoreductase [Ramlibacter sp.]HVZ42417.1 NAD(P)-dependent oxidoreductase [Ramlibacter sp.]
MDILLLERLIPEAEAWLESRHALVVRPEIATDPAAIRRALGQTQAVVLPRKVVVTREFLEHAPALKAVARMHVGTDNTDLEACRDRKVRVIQATTANVRSNAEYLLAALLLMFRRGIGAPMSGDRHAEVRIGRELNGSTIGILGLQPTAHTLALMLHSLGAKLIGYDPAVHHTAPLWQRLHIQPVSLADLMAQSDAVSLQMMYASRYQGFINDKVLAHCKEGQLWVCISRSLVFDTDALARALTDGRIEAAMVDGAESGFASQGSPLHEKNNLFLTPRLGSHTRESRLRASWYVAHRIHETLAAPRPSGFDSLMSGPMDLDSPPAPHFQGVADPSAPLIVR